MQDLRRVLRETLSQAFAGVDPMLDEPEDSGLPRPPSNVRSAEWEEKSRRQHRAPLQRFFGNKKFNDDAVKLYRNLSLPVYVVPAYGKPTTSQWDRATVMPDTKILSKLNVSPERIKELESAMAGGAVVLVVIAETLEKGFLPTPWMIIHAMFDNSPLFQQMLSRMEKTVPEVSRWFDDDWTPQADNDADADAEREAFEGKQNEFLSCLTMASARNGRLESLNDIFPEILTQAIITTKGFVFKPSKDPEIQDVLKRISSATTTARAEFEDMIAGKIVVVGAA